MNIPAAAREERPMPRCGSLLASFCALLSASTLAATLPVTEFLLAENSPSAPGSTAPREVRVKTFTPNTISLEWTAGGDGKKSGNKSEEEEDLEGYRIYYMHGNFTDVKTIHSNVAHYTLTGLSPFTTYEIWIQGIFSDGRRSPASQRIEARTDVGRPGPPSAVNATCAGTGSILVEWTRPKKHHKSVDRYRIFHRALGESRFRSDTVEANSNLETDSFVILQLEGNRDYVIKACAETQSLSDAAKTLVGEASAEVTVFLPADSCRGSRQDVPPGGELGAGMVGGAISAFLFLLLSVVGFVVWRRYFKAAYYYLDEPQRPPPPSGGVPDWEKEPGPEGQVGSIPVSGFESHVAENHADSDSGFSKEYGEIQKFCAKVVKVTHEHSSHPDNKCKNRYLNIVAYDHTRVKLMLAPGQKRTSDYVNANFIDGFQKCNAYIATQGPLEDTQESFWRMVWEQNVHVIVMITNLVERGRRKCDIYWPKDDVECYGQIEVQLEKEEVVMADYTIRTVRLRHLKLKRKKVGASERIVKQFHYTSWPDHGVPCHPLPVLTFVRKSAAAASPRADGGGGGPIVVHCSAGVGRTGTYIAIDAVLREMRATGKANVYGFLRHIRGQRNHLVQTEEQYVFVHDALVEAMRSGNTEIERGNLPGYVSSLSERAGDAGGGGGEKDVLEMSRTRLDSLFELITAFAPPDYQYASARQPANAGKNRDARLVPIESHRIALAPRPGIEGSDYVNASWLNGHSKLREFIVSQHPTAATKEDFWRMLWDHNAQTVALLSKVEADDDFGVFWPNGTAAESFDFETFRVKFVEETVHEGHSTFDLVVSSQHDDYELAVRIIHCPEWHSLGGGGDRLQQAFSVLKLVQDWHLEYQDGPLVVVDRYGGAEAATFCALTTLCKQLESFGSLDVYQVAKLYHDRRPGVWKAPADVLYLHRAMKAVVESGNRDNAATLASADDERKNGGIERRHSASDSSNLANADSANGGGGSRRHSLPSANNNGQGDSAAAAAHSSLPPAVGGCDGCSGTQEEEELDEYVSETVALTQKVEK